MLSFDFKIILQYYLQRDNKGVVTKRVHKCFGKFYVLNILDLVLLSDDLVAFEVLSCVGLIKFL